MSESGNVARGSERAAEASDDMVVEDRATATSIRDARIAKLEALRAAGVEPYAYAWDPDGDIAAACAGFEAAEGDGTLDEDGLGSHVRLAGRLTSIRAHGKATFADLLDRSGSVQLFLRQNDLGVEAYERLDLLDLGDWVGVTGRLMRTRMGEVSVRVRSIDLLAKSIRALPFGKTSEDEEGARVTHGGLADIEQRYRQRYADLAVNPPVRSVFRKRAAILRTLRHYLDDHGYVEVETPILQPLYGGATARPFRTHHHALDLPLYLRIADELYLKRLIVGGLERVYEVAKDFRNEGIDRTHFPEFTMLEFYEAYADYETMMTRVEEMVSAAATAASADGTRTTYQGVDLDLSPPFRRVRFMEELGRVLGFDPATASDDELRARALGAAVEDAEGMPRPGLLDALFGALVEPELVQPTFVLEQPRELSPLAKPKRGDPTVAERFELVIAGMEIANAFSELNDPFDQRERFEAQARFREQGDDEAHVVDEDYLRALEYGLPPTGGCGIGVDRLTMILTDQPSIRDVILFPQMRPE
ncbi:MAG TPA: lysine--tRNA ligase [Longimicrobiales bacterium]|nr:lysine--tRNA ligase [Longimicrobiales bacterium]